jgi:hypothetical protein
VWKSAAESSARNTKIKQTKWALPIAREISGASSPSIGRYRVNTTSVRTRLTLHRIKAHIRLRLLALTIYAPSRR